MRPGMSSSTSVFGAIATLLMLAPWVASSEVPTPEAYQLHCSGCHGADGRGIEASTPPLTDLADLLGLPGGREYLARVPGVAQAPLESAALAKLLNWTLREFSSPRDFRPYVEAEIDVFRKRPLRDPLAARPTAAARSKTD